MKHKTSTSRIAVCFAAFGLLVLGSPRANAQELARTALATFPSGTQRFAYADLEALRSLPNYRQMRNAMFTSQMLSFERFLGSLGIDAEKDVNEVVLGWRGPGGEAPVFFGLAAGQFDPDAVEALVAKENLPSAQYGGYRLIAFGPGSSGTNLFFTFFSSNLAAFGRMSDLKALIDGYQGTGKTLQTNSEFANWATSLDSSGPEWGITTGKAAAGLTLPLLPRGQRSDLSELLGPIKAVLYSVNWSGDFSAQISVITTNAQSASTIAQILTLARDAASAGASKPPLVAGFLQQTQISANGNRVEIAGSGSPGVLSALMRSSPGH